MATSVCPFTLTGLKRFTSTFFVNRVFIGIRDSIASLSKVINICMQSKDFRILPYVFQNKLEHIMYFGCVMASLCFNTSEIILKSLLHHYYNHHSYT